MKNWQQLDGWLDPAVALAMRNLILETKPNLLVEIGVFAGKSLINSALALKKNGRGVIYGIDPWNKEEAIKNLGNVEDRASWYEMNLEEKHRDCMRAIWDNELEEYAVVIRSASQYCHKLFRRSSIDILYIDGGHSEESSCRDTDFYLSKVRRHGYIWFDDANWESTQKAIELLRGQCRQRTEFGQFDHCHLYQKI